MRFYPSLSGGVSVFSNIGVHASQVEAAERDGKAVGVTSHTKSRIVRFDIDFSTESLEPGGYRLTATLPGG